VYLIPAFSGLGSPHWQMNRKAAIVGLTFGSTKNHIVRAALESIPYQIKDVIVAMEKDAGISVQTLMIDGGITSNKFVVNFLVNLLNKQVNTIGMPDVSALGAAYLAGLKIGLYKNIDALKQFNSNKTIHQPDNSIPIIHKYYQGWQKALTN
jgi:glycerol kinase